jgi:hypothetical protein
MRFRRIRLKRLIVSQEYAKSIDSYSEIAPKVFKRTRSYDDFTVVLFIGSRLQITESILEYSENKFQELPDMENTPIDIKLRTKNSQFLNHFSIDVIE